MKTGFYLCCVGIALMVIVEVSSQDQGVFNEPVDKRGLYLESAQSQNAAAAAGKQSSSYLNVEGGYPAQNYLGSVQGQGQSQFSAPGGWSGADGGSIQLGQQSSESALSHSSSNQYSKLIADGGYGLGGGQVANSYPQFLPTGLSSLQGQSAQSGAAATAAAHSSGSQFQGSDGGLLSPYYSGGGAPQYLQQSSQAEAAASAQAGSSNLLEQQLNYQPQPQRPLVQYPQEYYGSPNYSNGLLGSSGSASSAQASAGSSGAGALSGALAGASAGGASGLSEAGASASASSQSFQSQENPVVPRLKCGYVRQCKTVFEPAY